MDKLTYYGRIRPDGTLAIRSANRMRDELKVWQDKEVVLTVQRKAQRRSTEQNSYYWGVVLPVCRHAFRDIGNLGIDDVTVHEFFKDRFLRNGQEIILPGQGRHQARGSTRTLSKEEFLDYVTEIQIFMNEFFNVTIPDPEWEPKIVPLRKT